MAKTYIRPNSRFFPLLIIALVVFTSPAFALVLPAPASGLAAKKTASSALGNMSVEEFLALSPKKYKEMTGEKLSFSQKIALKLTQKKLEKSLKAGTADTREQQAAMQSAFDTSDFNIGGFVLGFLLSLVGVLIAYLIGDTTVIKWSWIGFGAFMVIFLLFLIF